MYQGTTPIIPLKFKGIDLSDAKIFLTLFDEKKKTDTTYESGVDFTVSFNGTDTVGTIMLSQEQTLAMSAGAHQAQARWIFQDGTAGATVKKKVYVNDTLLKGVIRYGQGE